MNLVLLFEEDRAGETTFRLAGRRARHVHEVHRAVPGDQLTVGLCGGKVGTGRVLTSTPQEVVLEVRLEAEPPAGCGVELLLAMPRPKVLKRLFASVASLGVKRLVLLNAFRVEKSYFDSPALEPESIRDHLVLGLEQARDTILPEVLVRPRFKPFVEDELEALWPAPARRLLADPGAAATLETVARPGPPMVAAVGPEGGWIPFEREMLAARGFRAFTLGDRILRVDTAVTAVVAQLQLLGRLK